MKYLYTKEEVAYLRKEFISRNIEPQIKAAFQKYDELKSAMLLVAQYWDDNSHDEVHYQTLLSVLERPVIPIEFDDDNDPVNLPEVLSVYNILESIWESIDECGFMQHYLAIPAFAAFCKEGSHQDMEMYEAYTPYAVFRRKEEIIEMEVVGEMLRPWLDGYKPERWRDDVEL